jgi:hypothetical protein
MSANTQTAQQTSGYSLYIPTINKKYSADYIVYLFWKCYIGNIDRIDFVPIVVKKEGEEPVEDLTFWQAFIYVRPGTTWGAFMTREIEERGSYRFYPHQLPHANPTQPGNPKEYWIVLKNKTPVPYAQTHLNIHQLANNNSLMEQEMLKMKEEIDQLKEEIQEIKDKGRMHEIIQQEVDLNNEFSSIINQTFESERVVRYCCDCREEEVFGYAELCCPSCLITRMNIAFPSVCERCEKNSVDNGNYICEECFYAIPTDSDDFLDLESGEASPRGYIKDEDRLDYEDDNYEDDGEASPRGRTIVRTNNGTYYKYDMLDVDGYNGGDVAPRGEKCDYEDDSESSPRGCYEDDGESSPRRYRSAEGSLGCNCSDNDE